MKDAEGQTKSFSGRLGGFAKTVGKVAVGALVGLSVAAVGAFAATKKVTEGFDDIAKNSRKMGVSTDYYQEMEYWASQNGVSHDNMEKSMKRLNQRIGEAANGNEKYSAALTELGIDMKAVEKGTVSTEEAMTQSIKSLSEMENGQKKAALASELFGTKLAQELMPALDSGALSIEDAQKQAEKLGLVIGEDTLNAAEDFNDTWDDLTRMVGAFGQKAIAKLMPYFQILMDWVIDKMPLIQKIFETVFSAIGNVLSTVGGFIQDHVIPALQSIWEWAAPYLPIIGEFFVEAFGVAKDIIAELIDVVIDVTGWLKEHWEIVEPILIGIAAGVLAFQLITGAIAAYGAITRTITAIQLLFNTALLANPIMWVVVVIGALVAAGILLYKNWDTVKEKLGQLWGSVKNFFGKIGDFIKDTWDKTVVGFNNLLSNAKTIFNNVKNVIMNPINQAKDSVVKAVSNLASGAVNKFNSLKDSATTIFNNVKSAITKPIESARDAISKIVDSIKGFFSNMKLSFPKLTMPKLPSFKLEGKFNLLPPSVPKLKINWNKDGGIFDSPTIFGTNKGLQGVGEAGAEAIIPLTSSVLGGIGKGIAQTMQGGGSDNSDLLIEQNKLLRQLVSKDTNTYLDSKVITKSVSNRQGDSYNMSNYMRGNR